MISWLQENGMEHNLAECREFPETGRGLAVVRDTKPNEILFTIPKTCLLNMDTLRDWARENAIAHLSATQMLAAFLATYKAGGSSSKHIQFYIPYLDSLPDNFDFHPLSWTMDSPMKQMHDTLPTRVLKKLTGVEKRFLSDHSIIQSILPGISKSNFLWGWLNVNTRSLYHKCRDGRSQEDHITMCPLLDFANHSISAPNFNTPLHRRKGHPIPSMIAPPDRGLKAGDQIFLLYGHHSNETMFTEYGFTDMNAPSEICIDEAVEKLFEDAKDGAEKSRILRDRGYWGDWSLHANPAPAHPSYRLIPILRLLHISLRDEKVIRRWEQTVAGLLDEVSTTNTNSFRSTLTSLCQKYHSEAVNHLTRSNQIEGLSGARSHQPMAAINRDLLWREQRDVTALVMESIDSGIEF